MMTGKDEEVDAAATDKVDKSDTSITIIVHPSHLPSIAWFIRGIFIMGFLEVTNEVVEVEKVKRRRGRN